MAESMFENLDVTPDEIQRLEKALKDEKFRQMLVEYAQELQDPENKRKYEEEISMLEQNRGMNVTFLNPSPGYVLKTNNGEKKIFVNICKCDKVAEPKAEVTCQDQNGVKKSGINWSMPYSLAPGREDVDKGGKTCTVYDVLFHPKSFDNCKKDPRLKDLMDSTALDGIEREFDEKLDRTNLKRPKMKFKGQPQATIIRTPNEKGPTGKSDAVSDLNLPYPYENGKSEEKQDSNAPAKSTSKISGGRNQKSKPAEEESGGPAVPKYTITHRGHFDMQHFTNARDSMTSTRPQELIVRVELPLLKSAAPVQLDVFEKQLILECKKPAAYKLNIKLPFPVDEEKGSAKFDKSKSCLSITLPVLPPEIVEMPSFAPESSSLIEEGVGDRKGDENRVKSPQPQLIQEVTSSEGDKMDDKQMDQKQGVQVNGVHEEDLKYRTSEEVKPDGGEAASEEIDSNKLKQNSLDSDEDEHPTQPAQDESQELRENTISGNAISICPSYTFKQDLDTVTFIIQAQGIDPASLQKEIHSDDVCDVKIVFRTNSKDEKVESDASNLFSFHVQFEEGCIVSEVMMEVIGPGAVIIMVKAPSCREEWSGFKAGASLKDLKEKKFLTEDNILDEVKISGKDNDRTFSAEMEVSNVHVTDEKLVADFKLKEDASKGSSTADNPESSICEDVVIDPATDVIIESLIGEASDKVVKSSDIAEMLKLDLNQNFAIDSVASMSDTSPPSTPNSARSLKSALRRIRRIHHSKSVSFSEDVEVEVLVSPGKTKKGKPRPLVAKRRVERLKGEAKGRRRRYHSDSEVSYNPSGGSEFWMEDFEEDFKKISLSENKKSKKRHSSSESESGQDERGSGNKASNSSKKSKPSKKQRKKQQQSKRQLKFENQERQDDSQESGDNLESPSSDSSKNLVHEGKANSVERKEKNLQSNVQKDVLVLTDVGAKQNGHGKSEDGKISAQEVNRDEVPLEFQDHRTKSEVDFQNEVMFELDD